LLLAVSFPVAVILAWAFQLTPAGVQRDTGSESPPSEDRRAADRIVVLVLGLALAYFVADKFFLVERDMRSPLEASVAVLPFTNMTQDDSNDPFAAGIHDDLLTHLSRIASLKTTSRTSVLQYRGTTKTIPQIGAELGVATIVEAGVQRSGNRVRINVQLIDAAADEHLWAETYDRELTAANVFEIQSEIARAIAEQLQAALTSDDLRRLEIIPTNNLDALQAYFIGKKMLEDRNVSSLTAAVEYFEKVVELDPNFALGWSGLADANMLLPEYSASVDRDAIRERSEFAVARALEIEPDNTNVLHWLSHTLSWQGRHDEAVTLARRAYEIEPDANLMTSNLAYILVDAREFEESRKTWTIVRARAPAYVAMRRQIYLNELRAGEAEVAAAAFSDYTVSIGGDGDAAREVGEMFIAYARGGEVGGLNDALIARTLLGSEDLAQVFAFVGDGEGAIAALTSAAAEHSGSRSVLSMKINPAYDFIRDDERFIALLGEAGPADL
jgi:TolB-like protein